MSDTRISGTSATTIDSTGTRTAEAQPQSCDPSALLAQLEGMMQREESAERKLRRASQTLSRSAVEEQVGKMRAAADSRFAAAITKAVTDMASGALELASGATGNTAQTHDGQLMAGSDKVAQGVGGAIAGGFTRDAEMQSAAATQAGAVADSAKRDAEEAGSAADDSRRARDKQLDHAAQIAEARAQAQMAAVRH